MRAWTNLLGLEAISLHLRRGAIFQAASSRTTCARHGPNGPSRLLPSVFPHLQQVAGLRTKSRPKAQPRLPYAKYVLPKKPTPQRVYPLKLKHSSKLAKDTDSDSGNANEWTWIDVSRSQSSTEELERELEWLANNNPSSPEIHDMFDELVEKRGSQPTTMHYEALILSNCNPQQGSVEKVEAILDELGKANIPVSASLYGAVLKVLAVHPNAILRQKIAHEMEKHWMPITPDLQYAIIAGMIREGQLELAQEKMIDLGKLPTWLHVLFIHALCDQKDFEAILHLTYNLQDHNIHLPRPTWLHVLQQASRHDHYDLTYRIWLDHVEPMYIIPDVHCCVRVLELASRDAQPKLAESAMAVLEDRFPEEAEQRKDLVDLTYKNAGQLPDPARHRKGNMFALLREDKGHHHAFFDPEIAMAKRPLPRFLNPKRLERKRTEKLRSRPR